MQHFLRAVTIFLLLVSNISSVRGRTTQDFDAGWLFHKGDSASAMMPAFDDTGWQPVMVPHDWSSDGPFSADYASGTGYAPGGIGWYRKHFQLGTNQASQSVAIEFDGVYDHAEVWINGQFVGGRPYGYSSFQCDVTRFVSFGSGDNVVAVRVDHSRFADSRYYTGSGIYRNVRLVIADKFHVAPWGVGITTPEVSTARATVRVTTTVTNASDAPREATVQTMLLTPDDKFAAIKLTAVKFSDTARSDEVTQQFILPQPQLWNLGDPKLYRVVSRIISEGKVLDEVTNTFGIRSAVFDANNGFSLNGKSMKLKGVCLHHDAGPLGAAVPDQVLERRLRVLKEIGVNAIRTSHNPPDPALLDLCDRLGFLVVDEALDEFTPSKNKWMTGWNSALPSHFGYGEIFAQWAVADVQDMVRRDRNHPSIMLWSIGNEIDYANDPFSHPVLGDKYRPENPAAQNMVTCAQPLIAAVKSLDRTRPVTMALATVAMSDAVGLPQRLDAAGYNYQESRYADDHRKFPQRIIYGSENSHRYDAWLAVQTNDFIAGQFLWTGADYLGEAGVWPNRANGAGLLDLCSFKKPLAWFRQSLWSDQPMVYLCASTRDGGRHGFGGAESWNWPSNSSVTVHCFANCPEVTLTLNGKVIGTKKLSEAERGVLNWQVPYETGTLKAIGRDENGRELCNYALQTAGEPARIELLPDTTSLRANCKDVGHVEFRIVDAQGVRVPDAGPEVTFELTGPARILGIGNGDLNSTEDCKTSTHHAFQGRGLAILQMTDAPGVITVKATATGLHPASITLQSQ
jgi:beta-galactosidase